MPGLIWGVPNSHLLECTALLAVLYFLNQHVRWYDVRWRDLASLTRSANIADPGVRGTRVQFLTLP